MTSDDDHEDVGAQEPTVDAGLNRLSQAFEEATTLIRDMSEPQNAYDNAMRLPGDVNGTMADSAARVHDDERVELLGAFRRFYVWRAPLGEWRARPLPRLAADEIAYGVKPQLEADTLLELAFACAWQRCRRNVFRYLQEYAAEGPSSRAGS